MKGKVIGSTRGSGKDQVIGKAQAVSVQPTAQGIASRRTSARIAKAVQHGMDAAETLQTIVNAGDSDSPELQQIASQLLGNPQFLRAMLGCLEKVRDDLKASIAAGKAEPTDEEPHGGPMYGESPSPNHVTEPTRGSGLPGTDSRVGNIKLAQYFEGSATSMDARHSAALDAEAAAEHRANVASANTPDDKARAALGLPPRPDAPSSLDAFHAGPREPARKDRPYDR